MEVVSLTQRSDGFYFSEEVGFVPDTKKADKKKKGGDKKDGKEKGDKKTKQN